MTKIVWREWYSDDALLQMEKMGTVPREEIEIDTYLCDGDDVAAAIAEKCHADDSECFRNGGEIVILDPAEFVGHYTITTEYEISFRAFERK